MRRIINTEDHQTIEKVIEDVQKAFREAFKHFIGEQPVDKRKIQDLMEKIWKDK